MDSSEMKASLKDNKGIFKQNMDTRDCCALYELKDKGTRVMHL